MSRVSTLYIFICRVYHMSTQITARYFFDAFPLIKRFDHTPKTATCKCCLFHSVPLLIKPVNIFNLYFTSIKLLNMLYSNMDKNAIQIIKLLIAYNILLRNKNKEKRYTDISLVRKKMWIKWYTISNLQLNLM